MDSNYVRVRVLADAMEVAALDTATKAVNNYGDQYAEETGNSIGLVKISNIWHVDKDDIEPFVAWYNERVRGICTDPDYISGSEAAEILGLNQTTAAILAIRNEAEIYENETGKKMRYVTLGVSGMYWLHKGDLIAFAAWRAMDATERFPDYVSADGAAELCQCHADWFRQAFRLHRGDFKQATGMSVRTVSVRNATLYHRKDIAEFARFYLNEIRRRKGGVNAVRTEDEEFSVSDEWQEMMNRVRANLHPYVREVLATI